MTTCRFLAETQHVAFDRRQRSGHTALHKVRAALPADMFIPVLTWQAAKDARCASARPSRSAYCR